ncbi:MAG: septum formation protein Maf [Alphaproteobacteria bacterium]|nr:septum formation protein Maf [Alphaproteobacteria bacterium]MBQ2811152.1 septum formation protein Maf [Alphaproteobacteria bacterium]
MSNTKDFILASGSPQRIRLLEQIGYKPKKIQPADIDENCLPHEKPLPYVNRMALEKAKAVAKLYPNENILACDTIVTVGLRILHKSKNADEQLKVMSLLSGRNHKVISSVCLIDKNGKISKRTVTTRIGMKRLSQEEINQYIQSNEWVGVCGYKIEGLLAGYVKNMVGSFTGVVGLPLYETKNLLTGAGIK